jgi:hypothetical protein
LRLSVKGKAAKALKDRVPRLNRAKLDEETEKLSSQKPAVGDFCDAEKYFLKKDPKGSSADADSPFGSRRTIYLGQQDEAPSPLMA